MAKTQPKKKTKRKVSNILISQPEPTNTNNPYHDLGDKFGIGITFKRFVEIEGVSSREFRKAKISPLDYTAIILTSRSAADHFFRICDALRVQMPKDTMYFCKTEAIALYLQNYIQYRKRKVLHGDGTIKGLFPLFENHPDQKYLFPCSRKHKKDIPNFLEEHGMDFDEAEIYRTVPADLSELGDIHEYDMLVFFTPADIKSLLENYPDFEQGDMRLAAFGSSTSKAVKDAGLRLDIKAPQEELPSMSMTIEDYLECNN